MPQQHHLLRQVICALQDALRNGKPVAVEQAGGRLTVSVPLDPDDLLTPCQRDVLAVVRDVDPHPITTTRLLAELDRRGMLHGESTVLHALPALVRAGRLRSSRRAPRGYRVA